ncbi:hypothetical protein SERLADRAFT_473049 [Serpula lacrymans var. lacrymans S7.9]|uniref:Uncharacterized protein n=1 Tax=Serpula lacrymans var. lacrymans (strain S7.9) TaxID=578457 RepID=F8P493_SERL9|nr:uncharacterized protein SERLADRAFT_473049 [Serpula lacrymans var. lacrymans S7.9]EGO22341.1 hypothetical protein SERLADRAFT_473049 [Serpula lacrymans var. lacrymans S7.9]
MNDRGLQVKMLSVEVLFFVFIGFEPLVWYPVFTERFLVPKRFPDLASGKPSLVHITPTAYCASPPYNLSRRFGFAEGNNNIGDSHAGSI